MSVVRVQSLGISQEAFVGHNKKASGRLDHSTKYTKRINKDNVTIVTAVSCPRMWREKNVNIFKDLKAKQTGGFED